MVAHSSETKRRVGGGDGAEIEPLSRTFVLQFAGQGVRPEDIIGCTTQLTQADKSRLNANIAIAEQVSDLHIGEFLNGRCEDSNLFRNNALVQVAIHTLNVTAGDIALRQLQQSNSRLSVLAVIGHSLGEVAAMDMAGVFLSRRESMEFVFARGTAMNRAHLQNPGNLYAVVGLEEEAVWKLCALLNTTIALKNSPKGFVVAGEPGIKERVEEQAKARGARAVIDLGLPGFHTKEYMLPAQAELRQWNEGRHYKTAEFPVFSNFDGKLSLNGEALVRKHFRSVTSPVEWQTVLANVGTLAPFTGDNVIFLTLGPGRNLVAINGNNNIPPEQTMGLEKFLAA